jgi:HSP20 family protein
MSEILLNVQLDITETETGLTIRADVPGFSEQDLEVRVAPRSMCITGKRQEALEQKERETVYSERRSNQIFRVLDLPSQIDPDRMNATLNNGILEIKLLKVGMGKKIPGLTKAAAA